MSNTLGSSIALLYYFFYFILNMSHIYECIIVWAWSAGIWIALKLKEVWVEYIILEWDQIWSSFKKWNRETRFISPSFPGNAFGQVDLNAIHCETSPGFMFQKEHVSWGEYAEYLNSVVKTFDVNIFENQKVKYIEKKEDIFFIYTEEKQYTCKYIISATGEFQFPSNAGIIGSEYAIHSSKISNYGWCIESKDIVPIIGWYESSIDVAYSLYKKGKSVHIFCPHEMDETCVSDPSQILSLYSFERFKELQEYGNMQCTKNYIVEIQENTGQYTLVWKDGKQYYFFLKPILATGFCSWLKFLWDYVSLRWDGMPELNKYDELKKTQNIFVAGPQVRQWEIIFCFIYKFRLRFWLVALEIAQRLWKDIDYHLFQKKWEKEWFYLDNLSHCDSKYIC